MSVNETNKPVRCGGDRASEVRQLDEGGATTLEWALLLAGSSGGYLLYRRWAGARMEETAIPAEVNN